MGTVDKVYYNEIINDGAMNAYLVRELIHMLEVYANELEIAESVGLA